MKVIKIFGGLGNQMFQYSFAKYLEVNSKDIVRIDNGVNTNKKDTYRKYGLNNFNISLVLANKEEVLGIKYPLGKISRLLRGISKKILRKFNIGYENWVLKKNNYYYDGFWQTYIYADQVKNILSKEFILKKNFSEKFSDILKKMNLNNSVSIHIRRGDYISDKKTKKANFICDLDYYKRAIKIIREKIKEPSFFIFSDDIEWVKENLIFDEEKVFISNPNIKDYEELILMSKCKNNIIANSTFSWWGAYLNKNEDKMIISPNKWNNKHEKYFKKLIPKEWLRI